MRRRSSVGRQMYSVLLFAIVIPIGIIGIIAAVLLVRQMNQRYEEQIKAEVYRILDETGQLGVMLGADCTVPMDIDEQHFVWVREACQAYAEEHRGEVAV